MISPLSVILVEDSESRGEELVRVLREGGFEVRDGRARSLVPIETALAASPEGGDPLGDPRMSVIRDLLDSSKPDGAGGKRCVVTDQAPIALSRTENEQQPRTPRLLGNDARTREPRHWGALDNAPLSLWQIDLSRVRAWLDARCLRNESALNGYLERHPLALLESSKQAAVVEVNETSIALFAANGTAAVVGTCDRLFSLGFVRAWRQLLGGMANRASSLQIDSDLTTFDGRRLRVLMSVRLSEDPEELVNTVVAICDITHLWKLELQEQTAQRMEAMRRLTGSIAHDFNNMLTVMRSYARFLQDECAGCAAALKDVGVILDAAERGTRLTNQLLAFSRRQTQDLQLVQLNETVGSTGRTLRRLIGHKIEVRLELADDLGLIRADPSQIEQILIDLAVNARDAMPTGGRLTVETANVERHAAGWTPKGERVPSGSYVMLGVSDAGIGMDESVLPHIFEPFFTTKEKGEGRGLGLSSAYGIVKQSGGHITVSSALGKGTSFKVYFPRVSRSECGSAYDAHEARVSSETILLVDDEKEVREAARNILAAEGYHVLEASNGAEALRLAEAHPGQVNLLVIDVMLPSVSGRSLADQLARVCPEMRVLYVSGCKDDAIVHRGVLDDSTAFVQKPFGPETLCRAVRQALDES